MGDQRGIARIRLSQNAIQVAYGRAAVVVAPRSIRTAVASSIERDVPEPTLNRRRRLVTPCGRTQSPAVPEHDRSALPSIAVEELRTVPCDYTVCPHGASFRGLRATRKPSQANSGCTAQHRTPEHVASVFQRAAALRAKPLSKESMGAEDRIPLYSSTAKTSTAAA
jgi:hypothetical protein